MFWSSLISDQHDVTLINIMNLRPNPFLYKKSQPLPSSCKIIKQFVSRRLILGHMGHIDEKNKGSKHWFNHILVCTHCDVLLCRFQIMWLLFQILEHTGKLETVRTSLKSETHFQVVASCFCFLLLIKQLISIKAENCHILINPKTQFSKWWPCSLVYKYRTHMVIESNIYSQI